MSEEELQERQLHCALDLFRRLPPGQVETNLAFVTELAPQLEEELLQTVDTPLKVAVCPDTKKDFLLCDYNRDGDSHRSPHSNKYVPALEEGGMTPPENLRKMEVEANDLFQLYADQYYESGGICSVYFWEVEDGFACCALFKKDGSGNRGVDKGIWDSIHVCEVKPNENGTATYNLTTTIMLSLSNKTVELSGSVQKQATADKKVDKVNTHVANIGDLIQASENTLLNNLQVVYFDKAREITRHLRSPQSKSLRVVSEKMNLELANALSNRKR